MQTSDLTDHISRRFNKDIEDLRSNVLTMGGLVETQLSKAIVAIVKGDSMPEPGLPESFNVLMHELKGLGLDIRLEE